MSNDLNITFHGSYNLLVWILKKYRIQLPYNGEIKQFVLQNNYTLYCSTHWKKYGVNSRVWNTLQKDLIICFLMNKIENISLSELKQMYEFWKKDDSIAYNDYEVKNYKSKKFFIDMCFAPPPSAIPPIKDIKGF
jgi:hypothetical protein